MLVLKKSWIEAEHILTELIARHDRFIGAYELLAQLREETARPHEACAALQRANELSPYRMTRLRHLGELALSAGDPATAERSLGDVVERGKYSEFRDPEDHVRLLQAQLALQKLDAARETLDDLERSMARHPKGELCTAIGGALIQTHLHDHAAARQSMLTTLRNPARLRELSVGLRQELVKACYDQQLRDEGTELLADLIRTAGDDRTLESTRAALRSRGLDQISREVEAKVQAEVKSLVTTGAQKAHAGDFDGAVAEMMNAARKMPGNPHVLFNAALALLRHIENRGWNEAFASQASNLIERAQRLSPANPRLAAITEFMHELMKRFGIAPGRPQTRPRQA
jgi:tetratricopeptide (TPR) repeat protein